eukprot:g27990.t1
MEDFLSSDAVADLAFGHCQRLRQSPIYCQRFKGVLSAAVKGSETVDTLRECYMLELEQKSTTTTSPPLLATERKETQSEMGLQACNLPKQRFRRGSSCPALDPELSCSKQKSAWAMAAPSTEVAALLDDEIRSVFTELEQWGECAGLYVHGSTIFLNNYIPNDLENALDST